MNLFQWGDFTLHSGSRSHFKIDCDALTDKDWDTIAKLVAQWFPLFRDAVGIPTGGLRFAKALRKYATEESSLTLVVDDVLTTGQSILEVIWGISGNVQGLVLFSRGSLPPRVSSVFSLSPRFR